MRCMTTNKRISLQLSMTSNDRTFSPEAPIQTFKTSRADSQMPPRSTSRNRRIRGTWALTRQWLEAKETLQYDMPRRGHTRTSQNQSMTCIVRRVWAPSARALERN